MRYKLPITVFSLDETGIDTNNYIEFIKGFYSVYEDDLYLLRQSQIKKLKDNISCFEINSDIVLRYYTGNISLDNFLSYFHQHK